MQAKIEKSIIKLEKHGISKEKMDSDAIKILDKLESNGYESYLVGGCIRDHLCGLKPKDYDIVTNAKPKQIVKLFPKSILIGRRFPLVHVRVPGKKGKIVEVATFRTKYADVKPKLKVLKWLQQFIIYGTLDQDARRRDLTCQALYWRSADAAIIDFHGGYQDALDKQVKVIGDARKRFEEDPVRVLRVLRVMAKLKYNINKQLNDELVEKKHLITQASASRLFIEVIKSLHGGFGYDFFGLLVKYKLHNILFPGVVTNKNAEKWILLCLKSADSRYASGQSLSPGYLYAVLLWPLYSKLRAKSKKNTKLADKVINKQHRVTSIPRKNSQMIEAIWRMQTMFPKVETGKKAIAMTNMQYFRAAYDFLLLRAEFTNDLKPCATKWQEFLALSDDVKAEYSFKEPDNEA